MCIRMKGLAMTLFRLMVLLLTLFLFALSANAGEITEVVSASPSWNTFTNRDGTGLYHDILREVFALYGVSVRHEYVKSGRAEVLVQQNKVDMMTCKDLTGPPLILARYPMYSNDFYVFFKKERIGPWKGNASLENREVLVQPTYYTESNFPVPVTIKTVLNGAQALGMILLDRSDFYVDDLTLIQQSIDENIIPFDRNEYDIQKVGSRAYRPLLNSTERGMAILKMYDDGIISLHKAGKLKPIYEKWGHAYPDFDSY